MERLPNLQEQEDYYTRRWNEFGFANKYELSRIAAVLNVLSRIAFETPPSICDLGCGAGWTTNILGIFGHTTGVDLSDTTQAALKYPHCAFISANVLEWEGPHEAFDAVVSLEVIEHIERPLQAKFIAVAHRLLKPGGHLILTTPNADTMRAMASGGREWSNQPLEEWLTPGELRGLLAPSFRLLEMESIISGIGVRGSYRLISSSKVRSVMQSIGAGKIWEKFGLDRMYGLHLVAHAQKPRGS